MRRWRRGTWAHRVLGGLLGAVLFAGSALCAPGPVANEAERTDLAVRGRDLREAGRYAEARILLAHARAPAARYELGLTYRATGARALERAVWQGLTDERLAGRGDRGRARALTLQARAAQLLGDWPRANSRYAEAVAADPEGPDGARANIAWARLFLAKFDVAHAEACLDEALAILPEEPEGRVLAAELKLEQRYDVEGAGRELDRALRARPEAPRALALRGRIALELGELEQARALARQLLAHNPAELSAHILVAGAALLRDDRVTYEAERARVLSVNPAEAPFFHALGELLVRAHRYEDAVVLQEEALRVDPTDAAARAAYGANLLRLGRETAGLAALREAWRADPYDVRTYNLIQLFDVVIAQRYTTIEAPPFRIRVPVAEQAVLEAILLPFLERARLALDGRYETHLVGPIMIELYADAAHHAVRSVGLPGLDLLGTSAGPVITAISPSLGTFNWGMVLWHELAHVYAIRASRSRVPRWYSEGLAEYETRLADPTWARGRSAELAEALHRGELAATAMLDRAFLVARDRAQLRLAYDQAAAAVRYLAERAGSAGLRRALLRFGEGRSTAEVLRELGFESPAAFDTALAADLRARLAGRLSTSAAAVELATARVHAARGEPDAAWAALERALEADPERSEPYLLMAELAERSPPASCAPLATACAIEALSRAMTLDVMDASIPRRLYVHLRATGGTEARAAAERGLAIAPFDGALRLGLVELALRRGDRAAAARELGLARACTLSGESRAEAARLAVRLGIEGGDPRR